MMGTTRSVDRHAATRHRTGSETLAGLLPAPLDGGVVLGVEDQDRGGAMVCRLFDLWGPTHLIAVGPLALGQHIVFRTLGVGAAVTVRTDRPHVWGQLTTTVDVPRDLLAITALGEEAHGRGTASRPHLLLDDVTDRRGAPPAGAPAGGDAGRWQCCVGLSADVTPAVVEAARSADLVLARPARTPGVGRLLGACGVAAGRVLMDGRGEGDVVALRGTQVRWLTLPASPVERAPRRASTASAGTGH